MTPNLRLIYPRNVTQQTRWRIWFFGLKNHSFLIVAYDVQTCGNGILDNNMSLSQSRNKIQGSSVVRGIYRYHFLQKF